MPCLVKRAEQPGVQKAKPSAEVYSGSAKNLGAWVLVISLLPQKPKKDRHGRLKPVGDPEALARERIIAPLLAAKLHVRCWYGLTRVDGAPDQLFVEVTASERRLLREARRRGVPLLTDKTAMRQADIALNVELEARGIVFSYAEAHHEDGTTWIVPQRLSEQQEREGDGPAPAQWPLARVPWDPIAIPPFPPSGSRGWSSDFEPSGWTQCLCPMLYRTLDPYEFVHAPYVVGPDEEAMADGAAAARAALAAGASAADAIAAASRAATATARAVGADAGASAAGARAEAAAMAASREGQEPRGAAAVVAGVGKAGVGDDKEAGSGDPELEAANDEEAGDGQHDDAGSLGSGPGVAAAAAAESAGGAEEEGSDDDASTIASGGSGWSSSQFDNDEEDDTFRAPPVDRDLYAVHAETNSVLSHVNALKMLVSIMEAPRKVPENGAGLRLNRLVARGDILTHYPLHCPDVLFPDEHADAGGDVTIPAKLRARVPCLVEDDPTHDGTPLCPCSWNWPVEKTRRYFGEEVAMYYRFASFLSASLIFPAFFGVVLFVWQRYINDLFTVFTPAYGVLVSLWATIMIGLWRRVELATVMRWGMSSFKAVERLRASYLDSAKRDRSKLTGLPAYYRPTSILRRRMSLSSLAVSMAVGVVVVTVLAVFFANAFLLNSSLDNASVGILSGLIVTLQIQIMSNLYTAMAIGLTNWENQPTLSAHQDSLIYKTFAFQFINNFASPFFIAFVKGNIHRYFGQEQNCALGSDGLPNCLEELQTTLATVFLSMFIVGNSMELFMGPIMRCVMPLVNRCSKKLGYPTEASKRTWPKELLDQLERRRAAAGWWGKWFITKGDLAPFESEAERSAYNVHDDYLELALLFGYTSLFVTASPLIPFVAIFMQSFETRCVDPIKLMTSVQRPTPRGSQGIGAWGFAFQFIALVSVVTNGGVVLFTNRQSFTDPDGIYLPALLAKVQAFILFEHAVFLATWFLQSVIPNDGIAQTQLRRQAYLVDKHIQRTAIPLPATSPFDKQPQRDGDEDSGDEGASSAERGAKLRQKVLDRARALQIDPDWKAVHQRLAATERARTAEGGKADEAHEAGVEGAAAPPALDEAEVTAAVAGMEAGQAVLPPPTPGHAAVMGVQVAAYDDGDGTADEEEDEDEEAEEQDEEVAEAASEAQAEVEEVRDADGVVVAGVSHDDEVMGGGEDEPAE